MHPPPIPAVPVSSQNDATEPDQDNTKDVPSSRRDSMSQQSEGSQTAADFIRDQLQLEADAREALPYVRDPFSRALLRRLRSLMFADVVLVSSISAQIRTYYSRRGHR